VYDTLENSMVGNLGDEDEQTTMPSLKLLYREDDANFKKRMNTAIQLSWIYNNVLTILVTIGIFYILDLDLVLGIVMGVLIAFFSSFHVTLGQVTQACHWEVYKNRVVMPAGMMKVERTIYFREIEGLERTKSMVREILIIRLKTGEAMKIDVGGQEGPVEAFERAYTQFARVQSRRMGTYSLPVVPDEDDGQRP
jgi:succinate-acetate transporter protein